MAHIKYTGTSHFRELLAADFKRLGVEGQKKTVWARGEVLEVPDEVAEVLIDSLGDEFDLVDDDETDEAPEPMTDRANEDEVESPSGNRPEEGSLEAGA